MVGQRREDERVRRRGDAVADPAAREQLVERLGAVDRHVELRRPVTDGLGRRDGLVGDGRLGDLVRGRRAHGRGLRWARRGGLRRDRRGGWGGEYGAAWGGEYGADCGAATADAGACGGCGRVVVVEVESSNSAEFASSIARSSRRVSVRSGVGRTRPRRGTAAGVGVGGAGWLGAGRERVAPARASRSLRRTATAARPEDPADRGAAYAGGAGGGCTGGIGCCTGGGAGGVDAARAVPGSGSAPARHPGSPKRPAAPAAARARASRGASAAVPATTSFDTPIEMVLGDVLDDPIGHQVPHRETPAHPVPAVGRRDRKCRNLQQAYVLLGQTRNGQHMSRATHSHEVSELPELVDVLPGEDLRDRVGTGDEEEIGVGPFRADVAQRVDRERRASRDRCRRGSR